MPGAAGPAAAGPVPAPGAWPNLGQAHPRGGLAVAPGAGIGWQLARTWRGGRARERQIKNQGGASQRCPLCGITPRGGAR